MGTLERIRQTSPFIIAAVAIIMIAFFVISDIDPNTLRGSGQTEEIAIVNDEVIGYKDFEAKARKTEEQQRDARRNNPEAEEPDAMQLRMQLFNQLVDQTIIKQEALKAGANVSEGAVLDVMLENPPQEVKQLFTDSTGRFDMATYRQFMTRPEEAYKGLPAAEKAERLKIFRDYFLSVQENVEMQLLFNNIQTLATTAGTVVSPLFAQEMMVADSAKATVEFLAFDINTIKDEEVKVSDDEIKKYYEDHKEYYMQREQRQLKYSVFPIVASKSDSDIAEKKVKRVYESLNTAKMEAKLDSVFKERLRENTSEVVEFTPVNQLNPRLSALLTTLPEGEFAGPIPMPNGFNFIKIDAKRTNKNEEVKASHILIKFGEDKAAAKAKIDEVYAKAKKGDFAELAKEFSQDGSAAQGGDLGFFKRGQMVKEFEEAAFNAKVDELVGPVETMFGYHLIKVAEKKSNEVEEISYSSIVVKPQISKLAKKQIVRLANEVALMVNEKGMLIDSAAKQLTGTKNLPIETPYFTKDRPAPGFSTQYSGLMAFTFDDKKAFGPWEDKNMGYVVAQVTGIRKAGIATLEDKKEEITAILKRTKKLDLVKAKAEQMLAQLQAKGGDLALLKADSTLGIRTAVDVKNNGTVPAFGRDFAFTQKAFMLELNKMSAPVRGERAYYIMQVTTRNNFQAPSVKEIPADTYSVLSQQAQSNAFNMWYSKVREDAKIVDKRLEIWESGF